MLFTSLQFVLFFVLVGVVYYFLPSRYRWVLLLAASYYFYACWKAGYLVLIVTSTLTTYLTGLGIASAPGKGRRKAYLIASVVVNLGLIAFFKYYNFFNDSLRQVFGFFGATYGISSLDILLPVGISFYTFQALSYTIDLYRGHKTAERHLGIFALYIAFFPQLVAGPIERSTRLLPQFHREHRFDYERITEGLSLMLWGFFKKLVIADRLAIYVDEVFNHPGQYGGAPLIVATYFFTFQIYCDFSGYSDIAVGGARVFGLELMNNFDRPYAARSLASFWRRWHISLSSWFRDYLYIPLGGNRCSRMRLAFNLFVVFLISGLWHGARWNFVVWGAIHGALLILSVSTSSLRQRLATWFRLDRVPVFHNLLRHLVVFNLVALTWIFFRANTVSDGVSIFEHIIDAGAASTSIYVRDFNPFELKIAVVSILFMEAMQRFLRRPAERGFCATRSLFIRWPLYYLTFFSILIFGNFNLVEFIYFQF